MSPDLQEFALRLIGGTFTATLKLKYKRVKENLTPTQAAQSKIANKQTQKASAGCLTLAVAVETCSVTIGTFPCF